MKLSHVASATLAPALSSAAALAMPKPTQRFAVAADNWSPAPTAAPQFNIFGREALQANESNTCGFVSGLSASSITCPNSQICATNTYFGIHGCCDPSSLSACTIATSCIASSAMSTSCTNDLCSNDNAIAKCTASTAPECYQYLFVYDTTTMSQQGCTSSSFTMTVPRTFGPTTTPSPIIVTQTVTASHDAVNTPTSTSSGNGGGEKKQSFGPIVGGTIGGCTILSFVALAAFFVHRRRLKLKEQCNAVHPPPTSQFPHNSPTFDPNGFPMPSAWTEQDIKTWQQTGGVYRPVALEQHIGVSEVHGEDRAVEIEAPEKTKSGHWQFPGVAPVEVEAPLERRDMVERPR